MDLIKAIFLIVAMVDKKRRMVLFGNTKGEKVMSKIIPLLMGSWITFCTMVGAYDGAVFLLFFYSLMLWDLNAKKATGAGNTDGNK